MLKCTIESEFFILTSKICNNMHYSKSMQKYTNNDYYFQYSTM